MVGNNFLDIMMHWRFMGHQSYVLLCTETTLSNPSVVQPKSSCDVHLLRSPWTSPVLTSSGYSHTSCYETTFKMQYPRRYVSSHVTQLNAKARSITRAIL